MLGRGATEGGAATSQTYVKQPRYFISESALEEFVVYLINVISPQDASAIRRSFSTISNLATLRRFATDRTFKVMYVLRKDSGPVPYFSCKLYRPKEDSRVNCVHFIKKSTLIKRGDFNRQLTAVPGRGDDATAAMNPQFDPKLSGHGRSSLPKTMIATGEEDDESILKGWWHPRNLSYNKVDEHYSLGLATERNHPAFKRVEELFHARGYKGDRYNGAYVTRIEFIQNDGLRDGFEGQIKRMKKIRHVQGLQCDRFSDNPERLKRIGELEKLFIQPRPAEKSNYLAVFHGCTQEVARSIARVGAVDLPKKIDKGFFGRGIYLTPNGEYAAEYATGIIHGKDPDKSKEYCVLMCYALVGSTYPITRKYDYPKGSNHSRFHFRYPPGSPECSKALEEGCDSHYVRVSLENNYEAAQDDADGDFDEIVVSKEDCVLPYCVIHFKIGTDRSVDINEVRQLKSELEACKKEIIENNENIYELRKEIKEKTKELGFLQNYKKQMTENSAKWKENITQLKDENEFLKAELAKQPGIGQFGLERLLEKFVAETPARKRASASKPRKQLDLQPPPAHVVEDSSSSDDDTKMDLIAFRAAAMGLLETPGQKPLLPSPMLLQQPSKSATVPESVSTSKIDSDVAPSRSAYTPTSAVNPPESRPIGAILSSDVAPSRFTYTPTSAVNPPESRPIGAILSSDVAPSRFTYTPASAVNPPESRPIGAIPSSSDVAPSRFTYTPVSAVNPPESRPIGAIPSSSDVAPSRFTYTPASAVNPLESRPIGAIPSSAISEIDLEKLTGMGFSAEDARTALKNANGNVEAAVETLLMSS